jgi:hypothetical protein
MHIALGDAGLSKRITNAGSRNASGVEGFGREQFQLHFGSQSSFGKAKGKGEKVKGKNCIDLFAAYLFKSAERKI